MAYPVLAPNSTWFTQGGTTVKRASITEIEIMNSYTPDTSVTVTDSWDASAAKNGSIMCYVIDTKLIIAGNGSGKIAANEDSKRIFSDANFKDYYENVINFTGVELLDVSNTTTLDGAFAFMKKVRSLNVSNWVIDKVTTIRNIFNNLNNLTSIDVTNWNPKNVIDFGFAFQQCGLLESVNLNNWDVRKVTIMYYMFRGCSALKSVNVSNWNTNSLTDITEMFRDCRSLTELDLSKWNVSNVVNMVSTFKDCIAMTSLNVSSWDVRKVVSMSGMFTGCAKLYNFDTANWNPSSCTNMDFMLYGCSSLKEIDVSNWDVSKVINFDHFAAHANLKRKGIENWKTTSATNMNALFHNCAEEELDLSGWDVSKNQFFCQMFENSPNLKRIKGLEKWDTSAGLGFDGMFERCYKLEEVDLSAFNTTKAKNNVSASTNGHKTVTMNNMFLSCNNLKKVKLGPNFSINGDGTNTTAANKLILPTPSTDYIAGADGNWYAFNGDPYAPNAIPDRTADIYFASFPLCQEQDVIVKNGSMIDTAKAIREKNGTTTKYNPSQFGEAIRALN